MELVLAILSIWLVLELFVIVILYALLLKERGRPVEAEQRLKETERLIEEALRRADEAETEALRRAAEYLKKKEKEIRADSVKRSKYVLTGKVAEQFAPFLEGFGYDPRDVRFLGSPVDLIVFDGLSEGQLRGVMFIEVKTGKSQLSQRERQLRDVIDGSEVFYEVLRIGKEKSDAVSNL